MHKKYKNIITAIIVLIYMYIVGLSPSVIRAGYLAIIALLARNINKEQDSFTTLAFIGVVSIVINPYITRNIGAMLSYSACVGILAANRCCAAKEFKENTRNLICAAAAVVFTMPVLAMAQMYVTLMSPVYNVMLAVFVTAICILSVITPIINLIPVLRIINPVLVMTNKIMITSLLNVFYFIRQYLDFTTVRLHSSLWQTVIFAALVAGFIAYIQLENKKLKKFFVISVSILAFVCYNLLNCNTVTVTAFDSGREGSFHIEVKGKEYLILTESITTDKAEQRLVSAVGDKYETIYCCFKEFKTDTDMSNIAGKTIEVNKSDIYTEDYFTLVSYIENGKKLFTVSVAGCDISFGHGKVISVESEYYFLGNDKPKEITADEIYIFGNTPSWMNVENITNIDSDIKVKINFKNGKYKTVKDVLNFGYRL